MNGKKMVAIFGCGLALTLGSATCFAGPGDGPTTSVTPGKMARVGTIDERFQSFNMEAVEVTGGRFWKPFSAADTTAVAPQKPATSMAVPGAMDSSL